MTTLAQWSGVPNSPDVSALLTALSIDPTSSRAVESMFVALFRHAAVVENAVNASVPADQRTSFYGNSIDENGAFRGTFRVPVSLGNLSVGG